MTNEAGIYVLVLELSCRCMRSKPIVIVIQGDCVRHSQFPGFVFLGYLRSLFLPQSVSHCPGVQVDLGSGASVILTVLGQSELFDVLELSVDRCPMQSAVQSGRYGASW
jgi:hypothetical protein